MELTKTLQKFNIEAPTTTIATKISSNNNKISTNPNQKVFQNLHRERPELKPLFNKISRLQLFQKEAPTQMFSCEIIKNTFFYRTTVFLLKERKILLKTFPIAIPNDISKAYYQKEFVIIESTYNRFMEFLIEAYNKGFSCS